MHADIRLLMHAPHVRFAKLGLSAIVLALVSACATKTQAPVVDRAPGAATSPTPRVPSAAATKPDASASAESKPDLGRVHTVVRGDTLIGIALQYGLDYRELAAWNNIENLNVIRLGDALRVTPPGTPPMDAPSPAPKPGVAVTTPLATAAVPVAEKLPTQPANSASMKTDPKGGKVPYSDLAYAKLSAEAGAATSSSAPSTAPAVAPTGAVSAASASTPGTASVASLAVPAPQAPASSDDVAWNWPVKGKVIAPFSEASKGLDISGSKGVAVIAAAPGKVTYAGNGIRGLGQLIVIRHSASWLSAYGHNDKLIVKEGQEIAKGQKIAEMGSSDTDQVKLHFQIRKQGRPVDPLKYLPPN